VVAVRQAARRFLPRLLKSRFATQVCDPFGSSTSARVLPTRSTVTYVPS